MLIDEALTPDSSRFWDAASYEPGRPQASFDKQFVRDWLERQPWDKTAPGPELPPDVVAGTRARYVEAYQRITGASLEPQGRAVENSRPHQGIEGVTAIRVGRRIEMTVAADDEAAARATVERL